MTEWTVDLITQPTEPDDLGPIEVVVASSLDDAPNVHLVADTLIDDVELDLVEWFA